MKTKLHIIIILTLSLVWLILPQAVCLAATYYLDAVYGDDSYDGLVPVWDGVHGPWQTLAQAQSVVQDGDTVILRSGNYGDFLDDITVRTDWVIYRADSGHTPVFTSIRLGRWDGPYNKYLHFEDITVQASAPLPAPWDSLIGLISAIHIKFINCTIIGAGYEDGDHTIGMFLRHSDHIEIHETEKEISVCVGFYL